MELEVFCGTANPALAREIGGELQRIGGGVGKTYSSEIPILGGRYNDGECRVRIPKPVRRHDVFLIQSTQPPADHWWELLHMLDAAKRSGAFQRTAVIPYFGCAREDKRVQGRPPIGAKLMCDLLQAAGATGILTVDIHAPQIVGFSDTPFDNVELATLLLRAIWSEFGIRFPETTLVSPDDGGVERCREAAKPVGYHAVTFCDKSRDDASGSTTHWISHPEAVRDRDVIILDDMIDSGGSAIATAQKCRESGARRIFLAASHAVFSRDANTGKTAQERLGSAPIDAIVVSDTIPPNAEVCARAPDFQKKVRVVSCATVIARAISGIHNGGSITDLNCELRDEFRRAVVR